MPIFPLFAQFFVKIQDAPPPSSEGMAAWSDDFSASSVKALVCIPALHTDWLRNGMAEIRKWTRQRQPEPGKSFLAFWPNLASSFGPAVLET